MASSKSWDAIIVGQGLAGTTLAWHLHDAGWRVLLLDANASATSSRIAAGLITTITGQRLTLSWRIDEFLPYVREFYRRIEQRTGATFFHDRTAVRLLRTDAERAKWLERLNDPATGPYILPKGDLDLNVGAGAEHFEMVSSQLDVAKYLDASRNALPFERTSIDWDVDVRLEADKVSVGGIAADRLISCEGYAASRNPFFAKIPFVAAKGDILTVRFHGPLVRKCYHAGIWVAPTSADDVFRVGATYDWNNLDGVPSAEGRCKLEKRLSDLISIPFTVLDHQAAVRPIIHLSKPLLGIHPHYPRLGYFNGLGSKGSLHAPWFARTFADYLISGTPLEEPDALEKFLS